jgi:hypothetical protein
MPLHLLHDVFSSYFAGWLQELLTLLWNNDFVIKKYAGIHDVKLKRKKWQRKDILKFLWFLTNKGWGWGLGCTIYLLNQT